LRLGAAFEESKHITAEHLAQKALIACMLGKAAENGDDLVIRNWSKRNNNNVSSITSTSS
jgi:hypothetical protein